MNDTLLDISRKIEPHKVHSKYAVKVIVPRTCNSKRHRNVESSMWCPADRSRRRFEVPDGGRHQKFPSAQGTEGNYGDIPKQKAHEELKFPSPDKIGAFCVVGKGVAD
jgi:hypothetical protein